MVSIIVPVYNVEKYIKECVDSLISQTYKDIEIILVDDGSTDSSPLICDDYAKTDSRIKVVHKKNGGLSSARNAGIEVAKGECFLFIDSDDYFLDDAVEQLVAIKDKIGSDIAVLNFTSDKDKLEVGINPKIKEFSNSEVVKMILREKTIHTSACAKLFNRDLFDGVRFPEGVIYEDYATVYKLLHRAKKVAYANTNKYFYRTNFESITKSGFKKSQMDYYKVSDEVLSFVKENYPKYKKYVINRKTRMSISFYKDISKTGFSDKDIIKFIVSDVRKNIFRYLFCRYSIFSKLYGVVISISPKLARKIFQGR